MFEHETDKEAYMVRLTYSYNVQVHGSVEVSSFNLALTRTPPGPAAVVPKRACLATDDKVPSPMYASLEVIKSATKHLEEADRNLKLAQRQYTKDYNQRVRLASIIIVGATFF